MAIQLSDFSLWGVLLLMALVVAAVSLLGFISRPLLQRLLKSAVWLLGNMVVLAVCGWTIAMLDSWWSDLLWLLMVGVADSFLIVSKARLSLKQQMVPVGLSVLSGMLVGAGLLWLSLPSVGGGLFVAFAGIMAVALFVALPKALLSFHNWQRHTRDHYIYLRANGATHAEAVFAGVKCGMRAVLNPFFRSWVKPLAVTPPVLFCGLLLAGCPVLSSVAVTMLTVLASLVCVLLAAVVLFWQEGKN